MILFSKGVEIVTGEFSVFSVVAVTTTATVVDDIFVIGSTEQQAVEKHGGLIGGSCIAAIVVVALDVLLLTGLTKFTFCLKICFPKSAK